MMVKTFNSKTIAAGIMSGDGLTSITIHNASFRLGKILQILVQESLLVHLVNFDWVFPSFLVSSKISDLAISI